MLEENKTDKAIKILQFFKGQPHNKITMWIITISAGIMSVLGIFELLGVLELKDCNITIGCELEKIYAGVGLITIALIYNLVARWLLTKDTDCLYGVQIAVETYDKMVDHKEDSVDAKTILDDIRERLVNVKDKK